MKKMLRTIGRINTLGRFPYQLTQYKKKRMQREDTRIVVQLTISCATNEMEKDEKSSWLPI